MAERHLRPVGKDCLVAFAGNLYSVPARKVRPRQLVEVRATKSQVMLHSTVSGASSETLLAAHPRAVGRGALVKQDEHWSGLPTDKNRRTTTGDATQPPRREPTSGGQVGPLQGLLNRSAVAQIEVCRRPFSVYDELTGRSAPGALSATCPDHHRTSSQQKRLNNQHEIGRWPSVSLCADRHKRRAAQ
ncbi:Mu transposase domain-containing protein [Streptomyces chartreusis]|uniref:Mu transposase domain-containing protein n=1 Tax=Streptomyces chartreusis TaxID=1969 RepID=UPI0038180995